MLTDSRRRIQALVIEDDSEMAELVRGLLSRRFSIEAQVAGDCSAARRLLRSMEYDLITLDYRLPDGAGLDLLDEITTSIEHPPVIMVTGHGDEETAARSFRSRASGYVVKDARLPDMLSSAVEKALSEIALKKVEKELLDEKAFIEDALNTLPDLFAVLDINGNFFRWNRMVGEVTGYGDEEISSMNMLDLFIPEDAQTLLDGMERMKAEGDLAVDRVRLITKDGETRNYELRGRVLNGHDGTPIGFTGTGRDITERMRMEEELSLYRQSLEKAVEKRERELAEALNRYRRQAEELSQAQSSLRSIEDTYNAVVDHSLDAVAILDSAGNFLHANPAGNSIAGYGPGELEGMNLFEMIHPDDLQKLLGVHNGAFDDPGAVKAVEVRMRHKGGGWRTLETVGHTFTAAEGEVRAVVSARDVTDARNAEEETRKFKTIADAANYGVCIVNLEHGLVYLNENFARAHGYSPDELAGESVEVLHRTRGQFERILELREVIDARGGWEAEETWHTRKDGSVFPMLMSAVRIDDHQGNALYIAATAIDMTDQKRAEQELLRLNRELEGYARTVSHDLRAPLTSIKLAGDTLARVWEKRDMVEDVDAEVRRIAEVIRLSAGQAEDLIRDLLTLAMSGDEPEDVVEVDVTQAVRGIIEEQEPLMLKTGAAVEVEGDLGTVRANPVHVYQLFSNFISNAIKHNDKPDPKVRVRYAGADSGLHTWTVEDNGPGIAPEAMDGLFLPFVKGNKGFTGIGLAIVDRIIKLYGGSVKVSSAPSGDGTTFEFSMRDRSG